VDIFGAGMTRYQTNTIEVLTYLSVPVSVSRQIHMDKNGKHRLILSGGMNFSYLIKAMAEGYSLAEHTPSGTTEVESTKIEEIDPIKMKGYNLWDFSLHVGGGTAFN